MYNIKGDYKMKKQYVIPEIEIVETELSGMLCLSTPLDGDATGPANAPLFDDELDDWDEE